MTWPLDKDAIYRFSPRGIKVFLRRSTWFEHICDGHPEMHNCLKDVLLTLEAPEMAYEDGPHGYNYRYSEKVGSFIMLIFRVSRTGARIGWVKTAYLTQNPYVEVSGMNKVWPI
jgi:hypothetical protein